MHGSLRHPLELFDSDVFRSHVAKYLSVDRFGVFLILRADDSVPAVEAVELDEMRNQQKLSSANTYLDATGVPFATLKQTVIFIANFL